MRGERGGGNAVVWGAHKGDAHSGGVRSPAVMPS